MSQVVISNYFNMQCCKTGPNHAVDTDRLTIRWVGSHNKFPSKPFKLSGIASFIKLKISKCNFNRSRKCHRRKLPESERACLPTSITCSPSHDILVFQGQSGQIIFPLPLELADWSLMFKKVKDVASVPDPSRTTLWPYMTSLWASLSPPVVAPNWWF